MPAPALIPRLPAAIRAWLDDQLQRRGFGDYAALTEALNARLQAHGLQVSLSMQTVGRYGKDLKGKVERIRAATAAAAAIAAAAPDEEGQQSAAVTALLGTELFERLMDLDEVQGEDLTTAERIDLIARASRAHADLTRASIAQRKWAGEVRRAALTEAAARVAAVGTRAGLTAHTVETLRREILGVE